MLFFFTLFLFLFISFLQQIFFLSACSVASFTSQKRRGGGEKTEEASLSVLGALERATGEREREGELTSRSALSAMSSMASRPPPSSTMLRPCQTFRAPGSATRRIQARRRRAAATPKALPSLSTLFDSVARGGALPNSAPNFSSWSSSPPPLPLFFHFLDDATATLSAATSALSSLLSDPALRAALGAVASVAAVVVAVGRLLAAGALPKATGDVLARVSFVLLLPCLQFVSVGTTLARMKLSSSGAGVGTVLILPLAAAAHVAVGLFLG